MVSRTNEGVKPTDTHTARIDIQWMRALAVTLVLVYHFWPTNVKGGFVGVDIFFVISGFLITTHLLTKPPRRAHDLVVFWGRRVRRLLPAAFTVIIVTVIATLLILPMTQWQANGWSAIWSGLYIENWNLAWVGTNYLASTAPPTALQHYWSLSVEEQFYLIWPILLALVALLVRKRWHRFRLAAGLVILGVVALSFAFSALFTSAMPTRAYFITPTRMWELGAGGLLAVIYPRLAPRLEPWWWVRLAMVAAGIAAMVWSGFTVTGQGFPGYIAAIPVLGALLVIAAGPGNYRYSLDRILAFKPIRFVGDASYSIYLWHWPLVILIPWTIGRPMDWPIKLGAIALTLGLSWLSKTFIEDRFRGSRPLGVPLRRTFIFLVLGMVATSAVGTSAIAITHIVGRPNDRPQIPENATCVGAAIRLDPACAGQDPHGEQLLTEPLQAANDRSVAYKDDCWWWQTKPTRFPVCHYPNTGELPERVALWGNSHAGPYLEPLIDIGATHGWGIRTYLAAVCFPSLQPLVMPLPGTQQACQEYTTRSLEDMKAAGIELVVMSIRPQSAIMAYTGWEAQHQVRIEMFTDLLELITSEGLSVLVIHDVPYQSHHTPDCVEQNRDNIGACDGPRYWQLSSDPLFQAAEESTSPKVSTINFSDALCDDTTCWDVIGGVIAYYDPGHLTTTFTRTLQPYLEDAVLSALE
ncbi:MAG: acyltransferase [Propionibacteriaceae bacterium]|jgi:peptidoglycan/LPS O-acetylase OafA/YrhL|nr:acyltransferase [Propionibacteriaceae bacterium]